MKYLVGILFSLFVIGLISCGNDEGESPEKRKTVVDYKDFYIYAGSAEGAIPLLDLDTVNNKDSLLFALMPRNFGPKFQTVRDTNQISFEFHDDDKMTFTDLDKKIKIISSYEYKDNTLFVLKNGITPEFVAYRDENGEFYRTMAIQRIILDASERSDVVNIIEGNDKMSIDNAFKNAGFDDMRSMTNPKDTIVWCNVKHIYR